MNMLADVLTEEGRKLPARLGGLKGALAIAFLLVLAALPPFKFGPAFLDPQILLAYAAFAMLFAGPFAAQSFGGASELVTIEDKAIPARDLVVGKTIAAALYGWVLFGAALGAALVTLNSESSRPVWPTLRTTVGLLCLSLGAACFAAATGARVTLAVRTARASRQLLRLGFLFLVLMMLAFPRVLPFAIQEHIHAALTRRQFPVTCLALAVPLLVLAVWLTISAIGELEERRQGLSILGGVDQ